MGAGYSSTLPSLYNLLEQYIKLNNSLGALFAFSGGLMATINTLVIGKFIDLIPLLFVYNNIACTIFIILLYVLILTSKYFVKLKIVSKVEVFAIDTL